MRKILLLGLTGLMTFSIFLVVFAPAALLWNLVKADAAAALPDLQVLTVDGTVWRGNANLRYREFPSTDFNWTLEPLPLMSQQVVFSADLAGDGLAVTGDGTVRQQGSEGQLQGFIDASYINSVASRYGMSFPGRIEVLAADFAADRHWLTAIDGKLTWGGGRVLLQTLAGTQAFLLPPLEGDLSLNDSDVQLDVVADEGLLIRIRLRPTGWAIIDIKARLLKISGMPWPSSANPDLTAFVLEEKVF